VEELDREVLAGETRFPAGDLRSNCYPGHFYDVKFPLDGPDGPAIGGIAIDLTDRVIAERAAHELAAFERAVGDIAARLSTVVPEKLAEAIDFVLRTLAEFLGAERSFFGQFSADQSSLTVPQVWHAPGIRPTTQGVLDSDLAESFPEVARHLAAGKVLKAETVDAIPEELGDELPAHLARDGIKGGLLVPILVEGVALGFLGLDSVTKPCHYPDSIVERLGLVADVLGATIARTRAESALKTSVVELERLRQRLERENVALREEIDQEHRSRRIVGESDALAEVLSEARQVAETDSTVLLLGETGTGKELLARFIHEASERRDRPLVKVNCATLPATLVESELFGRERGAYTGAMTRQEGRFEVADGATIFLDEIGELPLETQVKLLRVLEEGEFERLGSSKTIRVDVRVIAATNHDLQADVGAGGFREDLFYRLNVFPLQMPALRERPEDVPLLAWAFVRELSESMGKPVESIARDSLKALGRYSWPGNVRELRNVIERAMILCHGTELHVEPPGSEAAPASGEDDDSLDGAQRRHILEVLERTGWKVRGKGGAAELLEMKPSTLENRMKKLGIFRPSH
jgi:transcriptional regulator with GAF, ATPase, and Fis domain